MKRPLRFQKTFRALVHGWLAYSGLISAALLFMGCFMGASGLVAALVISLLVMLYSMPFALVAWLLVALPVDACLSEKSAWRQRESAWILGAGAGAAAIALPACFLIRGWTGADAIAVLVYSLLAAVCGARAADYLAAADQSASRKPEGLDQTNTLLVRNINTNIPMNTLTLFYDARCGLCSQVRRWLETQPAYLRLEFIPYDSPEAVKKLPAIRQLRADEEIVVLANTGEVWQGAGAWVICLWALKEYRAWSARLASAPMQAVARKLVYWISANRIGLSRLLHFRSDAELTAAVELETASRSGPLCELPVLTTQQHVSAAAQRPHRDKHDLDLID